MRYHPWVELPGNIVFEASTQLFYDRDDYYRVAQPKILHRYTPGELAKVLGVENWRIQPGQEETFEQLVFDNLMARVRRDPVLLRVARDFVFR